MINIIRCSTTLLVSMSLLACVSTLQSTNSAELFGSWEGVEYFRAVLEDEKGQVPKGFMDNPFGVVPITLMLSADVCSLSKSDEPPVDCIFDSGQRLIVVPGGLYGADYEPGYQLSLLADGRLKIKSVLKNFVQEKDYSYTYIETSSGVLSLTE